MGRATGSLPLQSSTLQRAVLPSLGGIRAGGGSTHRGPTATPGAVPSLTGSTGSSRLLMVPVLPATT